LLAAFAIPVGVGVVLFAVLTLRGDGKGAGRGFYLEALVVVDESARTVGTNIAGGGSLAGERDHHETLVRWWYRDARHFRVEYETASSQPGAGGGFTYVRDGDRLWSYDAGEQTYTRTDADAFLPATPRGSMVTLPSFSILLGWAPGGLDQLVSLLEEIAATNEGSVEVTGEAQWLGRAVTVIEMTPAASSQVNDGPVERDGVVRYSIDEASGFILVNEAESEVVSYRAEVTLLDEDRAMPNSIFSFTPPPGATELADDGSGR